MTTDEQITTQQGASDRLDSAALRRAREARRDFMVAVEGHRPALFRYCRRLTGNVWDAEDLVQETLARGFARAAETHFDIRKPEAWLVRIATNTYIDQARRSRPEPWGDCDVADAPATDRAEVRDAIEEMITVLPPQERAAVVLKDVFDFPLADIASMVGTTTGAVKSALHRGRDKLAAPVVTRREKPRRAVLDAAAEAFTAYDIDRLVSLFLDDGVMHIVGAVHETGGQQMRDGSFEHTFNLERDVRYTAEVRDFEGEPLVAIFSRPSADDGSGEPGLAEVWRCVTIEDRLAYVADYFFCPEVVTEVAAAWGVPTALHGYRYH